MPDKWRSKCGKHCLRCWRNRLIHACPNTKNCQDFSVTGKDEGFETEDTYRLPRIIENIATTSNYKQLARRFDIPEGDILTFLVDNNKVEPTFGKTLQKPRRTAKTKGQMTWRKVVRRKNAYNNRDELSSGLIGNVDVIAS